MELDTVSSTITNYSSVINADFPIPGVDNDTQGFRTNYTNIKTAFSIASTEISDLQLAASDPADLILNSYSKTELYNLGTVDDGTMVFVTPFNRPAYSSNGLWYMMTGTNLTLP